MPDHLWHALAVGPMVVLAAIACVGAGPWPQRLATGIVAAAFALFVAAKATSPSGPSIWSSATAATFVLSSALLGVMRAAGWRFVSDRRIVQEGSQLHPPEERRYSLGELMLLTVTFALFGAAAHVASSASLGSRMPVGTSFAASLLLGAAGAGLGFLLVRVPLLPIRTSYRVAAVAVFLVATTLALEGLTDLLQALDEASVKSLAITDQLEKVQRGWWRWTAVLTASVAASMTPPLAYGLRWRRWMWD